MHRAFWLVVAGLAAGFATASGGQQNATPINERAGLYACRCGNGRAVPPVVSQDAIRAWREWESLSDKLGRISRRLRPCLENPPKAGSYQDRQCQVSASEKASIERQLASLQAQARRAEASVERQCRAACAAAAAPAGAAPPRGAPGGGGPPPVGNDWSLTNTISGRKPITGLSPIQLKWEAEKQKTLNELKPAVPKAAPKPKAGATAAKAAAPTPAAADLTGGPDLDKLIAEDLLDPGAAEADANRAERGRLLAPHITAALPATAVRDLTTALRSSQGLPNAAMNPALDDARLKALASLERAAALAPPDPKRDLRPFFRNKRLFDTSVVPALKILEGGQP